MVADANRHAPDLPTPEHLRHLSLLLGGYRVSQALYVVVKLGIPDLLANGPCSAETLAKATGSHPGALYRVLRFLSGVGIFEEITPYQFSLTTLGMGLRMDVPGSMRATMLMHLDSSKWQSWGQLLQSVQTGETAFQLVHGLDMFAYLEQHPDAASIFQQAMTNNTLRSGRAIVRAYDFSDVIRLVDVGGGQGQLLATILQAYPAMRGVLFDLPSVLTDALAVLAAADVADRCEVEGGDFFASVPAGGDAYILRQILHDWDDTRAALILKRCRQAMSKSGRILVVEGVVTSNYEQALPVLQLDLEMLVNFGGRQRSEDEYRTLFALAGFQLKATVPLGDSGQFSIFEGIPTGEPV